MTDKVIVFSRDDGGVSVVNPVWKNKGADEPIDAFLARIAKRTVPEGATWRAVDRATLPKYDSATRNRWRMVDGVVRIEPS